MTTATLSAPEHTSVITPSPAAHSDSLTRLQQLMKDDLQKVDQMIAGLAKSETRLIIDLTGHIISSGGKRLRPLLTLVAAKMCGYTGEGHIPLAAAVEFIHTATLLHDDVVDGSELRRGNATANHLWGNKASILVGDFLLSQAFLLMVDSKSLEVLEILSRSSAIIAEGEVLQLMATHRLTTTEETYIRIVTAKTAQLFSAACEIGAVVANSSPEVRQALREFGLNLGIAFQIIDDALDYSARQEELGKAIGDDFREGKVTLPLIHTYANADEAERVFWKKVIERGEQEGEDLYDAIAWIKHHGSLDYAMTRARHYAAEARAALAGFPDTREKLCLLEILEFSVNRPY